MKCYIDSDELYPVYSLIKDKFNTEGTIELTDEELKSYNKMWEEYDKWQERLEKACNENTHGE